ncbi:MAG: META domain-containing protein [Chloroflexia bacterium]
MQRLLRYVVVFSVVALGLLSVGSLAFAQAGQSLGIAGAGWRLAELQRAPGDVRDTSDVTITLNFDGQGEASGQSTCNGYSTTYQQGPDNTLTFGNILSTKRACMELDLEIEYYNALQGVSTYNLDNATLKLFYNNGNGVLTFESAPAPVIGMPQTGAGFADVAPFAVLGVSLVLLGAGFLVWRRSADLA